MSTQGLTVEPLTRPEYDARGRRLFQVGETVTIPFMRFPGPVSAPVQAKVIKRHSPTYYEFEWADENGKIKRRSLLRGHFPD